MGHARHGNAVLAMSDEAREAAVMERITKALASTARTAYAAGVAEGIRLARDEVRLLPCYGPNSREMEFDIGPFARTQVLEAIDNL